MWQLFGEIWLIYIPSSGHTGSFRWFNCSCGLDCGQGYDADPTTPQFRTTEVQKVSLSGSE